MTELLPRFKALAMRIKKEKKEEKTPPYQPSSDSASNTRNFLSLPAELRNIIYAMVLIFPNQIYISYNRPKKQPPLLRLNHQIRHEAFPIYYLSNTFAMKPILHPLPPKYFPKPRALLTRIETTLQSCRTRSPFPLQSLLQRTPAKLYEFSLLAHWQMIDVRHVPFHLARDLTWEILVEWASDAGWWRRRCYLPGFRKWFEKQCPSQRVREFWMVLIRTGTGWREAWSVAGFMQWVIDERVSCKWTISSTRPSSLTSEEDRKTGFIVRLRRREEEGEAGDATTTKRTVAEAEKLLRMLLKKRAGVQRPSLKQRKILVWQYGSKGLFPKDVGR